MFRVLHYVYKFTLFDVSFCDIFMCLICSNYYSVLLRSQLISNLYQRLVGRRDLINLKTSATTALPTVRAN